MFKDIDERIGISKNRYQLLFSMENAYGILKKKADVDAETSKDYECVRYSNHDCVYPTEVLVDIMFRMRSGEKTCIEPEDIVCVCVNGLLYTYRFFGVVSWDPEDIEDNFKSLGTDFFSEEKKEIVEKLHKHGLVLNVLGGSVIALKDEPTLRKFNFYGIEKEIYPFKPFNMISEYSIYKLKNDKITKVNPNGTSFYDIKNALYFFLKKCKGESTSILLFNRRELEMIKDCFDIKIGSAYGS